MLSSQPQMLAVIVNIQLISTTIVPQKQPLKKQQKKTVIFPLLLLLLLPSYSHTYLQYTQLPRCRTLSKWTPRNLSFQLHSDEVWDTVKAQILVKISAALNPPVLDFTHYDILLYIPHVISKPSIPFVSEPNYTILLQKTLGKDKIKTGMLVNLTIVQLNAGADKENVVPQDNAAGSGGKSKPKTKDPSLLPGNMKKTAHIEALWERWRCKKKQATCFGAFCYIDANGNHVILNNECLDCWVASIMSYSCS